MKSLAIAMVLAAPLAAACGGDAPGAPDAGLADATPTGAVHFGDVLGQCPEDVVVTDSYVYWVSKTTGTPVVSRSPIGGFAPEVVYTAQNNETIDDPTPFHDGLLWTTGGGWPVQLDGATGEVHPFLRQGVSALAVVDGARVFVVPSDATALGDIDEVGADGALAPVAYAPVVGRLVAGPSSLYWTDAGVTKGLDVVNGKALSPVFDLGTSVATHADKTSLYLVGTYAGQAGLQLASMTGGTLATVGGEAMGRFLIAGGDGAPLYVIEHGAAYLYAPADKALEQVPGVGPVLAISDHKSVVFVGRCNELARLYPSF